MSVIRARKGPNSNLVRTGDNTLYFASDGVSATSSGGTLVANRLYAMPLTVNKPFAATQLVFEVTTGAAGNARAGIYLDAPNGQPGALLVDGGNVDTTATAVKTSTIATTIPAGLVWLVFVSDIAAVVRVITQIYFPLGWASTLSAGRISIVRAFTYAALPADESAQSYSASSSSTPAVFVRA